MVEKVEGAEMECRNCGTELVCRMKEYGSGFAPKLQWQNVDDGKAHYHTKNGKDFTCNIPGEPTEEDHTIAQKEQSRMSSEQNLSRENPNDTISISAINETLTVLNQKVETLIGICQSTLHIVDDLKLQQNKEEKS